MASDALEFADARLDAYWPRAQAARDRHIAAWTFSLLVHGGLFGGLIYLASQWTTPPTFGVVSGRMSPAMRGSASAAPRKGETQEIKVVFTEPAFTPPPAPEPAQPKEEPVVRLNVASPPAQTAPRDLDEPKTSDDPEALVLRPPPQPAADAVPKIEAPPTHSVARARPTELARGAAADLVADVIVPARASSAGSSGANVDQTPRHVPTNPLPPYPLDALSAGIEGEVVLWVRIAADGSVASARVEHSSGTPSLDESARSTVERRWRFVPARRGGVAVAYEATLPVRFSIRLR